MVSAPSARRLLRCWTPVGGSSIITLRRARSSGDGTATLATYAADWSERMLSIAPRRTTSRDTTSFDAGGEAFQRTSACSLALTLTRGSVTPSSEFRRRLSD